MKTRTVLCAVCMTVVQLRAQQSPAALQRLASPVDSVRLRAFYQLVIDASPRSRETNTEPRLSTLAEQARQQPPLAAGLIALLARENDLMKGTAARRTSVDSGTLMDYRIDVATTVALMRDPASITVLRPWVGMGGPVPDALTSFGEAAVPALVAALTDAEHTNRMNAAWVLSRIIDDTARSLTASARATIKVALLRVLQNESSTGVRLEAVAALSTFPDGDVRTTMERLAASDPAKDPARIEVRYPVREAAHAWLVKHAKQEF